MVVVVVVELVDLTLEPYFGASPPVFLVRMPVSIDAALTAVCTRLPSCPPDLDAALKRAVNPLGSTDADVFDADGRLDEPRTPPFAFAAANKDMSAPPPPLPLPALLGFDTVAGGGGETEGAAVSC